MTGFSGRDLNPLYTDLWPASLPVCCISDNSLTDCHDSPLTMATV